MNQLAETGIYTLTIKHLGPVELSIQCAGKGNDKAYDKLNPNSSLSLNLPVQPSDYYGDLIHEAEDMDYKSVGRLVTHQYNQARNYRGHSGMGMVEMGSNTAGSLRDSIYVKHPGAHSIRIRYVNTSGKNFNLTTRVNGSRKSVLISKTNTNDWQEATVEAELKEGGNAFIIQNTAGVNFTIDCVTYSPADQHTSVFELDSVQVAGNTYPVSLKEGDYKFSYELQSEDGNSQSNGDSSISVSILDAKGNVVATNSSNESPEQFYFSVANDGEYTVQFSSDPAGDINIAHAEINSCFLYHVNLVDAETEGGTATATPIVCEAGTEVTLSATPNDGFAFNGWDIIVGNITISEEGTFIMPERDVNIKPIFNDKTNIYTLNYNDVNTGTLPPGWVTLDGTDEHSYPNSYSSGSRTFRGFNGYQGAALYWRNTRNGAVIAEGETYTSSPNANGNTAATVRSAQLRELPFVITEAGNYLINFENMSGGYDEYLILECRINIDAQSDAIDIIANDANFHAIRTEYFSLDGQRLSAPQRGIILRKQTDANGRTITQKMMVK